MFPQGNPLRELNFKRRRVGNLRVDRLVIELDKKAIRNKPVALIVVALMAVPQMSDQGGAGPKIADQNRRTNFSWLKSVKKLNLSNEQRAYVHEKHFMNDVHLTLSTLNWYDLELRCLARELHHHRLRQIKSMESFRQDFH